MLASNYRQSLWDVYARSISLISVAALVAAFVMGGYSLVKIANPALTLASSLHEKYQTNESYTQFGTFKKDLSQEEIKRERMANYEQLLRMERRDAKQRLIQVGFSLIVIATLNAALLFSKRLWRADAG